MKKNNCNLKRKKNSKRKKNLLKKMTFPEMKPMYLFILFLFALGCFAIYFYKSRKQIVVVVKNNEDQRTNEQQSNSVRRFHMI